MFIASIGETMREIRISEIVEIVSAGTSEPIKSIDKLYDWKFNRAMELTKWILATGAALISAFGISLFKEELKLGIIWQILGWCSMAALVCYGFYRLSAIKKISQEYASAIKLYKNLEKIQSFLQASGK